MKIGLLAGNDVGHIAYFAIRPEKVIFYPTVSRSVKDPGFVDDLDLILSVHCREIVPKEILEKIPCYNVHPCLYRYKGADPIGRAIQDKVNLMSVGMHQMTTFLDTGKLIAEEFIFIEPTTRPEIYRKLYPVYLRVIEFGLSRIRTEFYETLNNQLYNCARI